MLVSMSAGVALAQEHIALPPVNLGGTSFMDGLGGPGLMNRVPLTLYAASRFVGPSGQRLPGRNRLLTLSAIAHAVYSPSIPLFGGYWGLEILVPAAYIDLMTRRRGGPPSASGTSPSARSSSSSRTRLSSVASSFTAWT